MKKTIASYFSRAARRTTVAKPKAKLICDSSLVIAALLALASVSGSKAGVIFSDNFTTADGNLTSYNSWQAASSGGTSPIQINNNAVAMGTSGEDDSHAAAITATPGTSFYIGVSINVSAAQAGGDYFLNEASTLGSSTLDGRVYIKSSGAGFVLGVAPNSTAIVYGSTLLSFGTVYNVGFRYDFITGTGNDSSRIYLNPTGSEGANTAEATATASSGTDLSSVGFVSFRQGAAGNAATLTIDNLVVGSTFADIAAVPEPAEWGAISAFGLLGICGLREWRQRRQQKSSALA